jgi:hypothetical protein
MKPDDQQLFDEAFRKWSERPLGISPDVAARRLMAQLPERRKGGWFSGHQLRFATAAAGLALALIISWVTLPRVSRAPTMAQQLALPPLSDDVVLLWLDNDTPLYLTVASPATRGDS